MNEDQLQRAFRHFASVCEGQSPLYVALSNRVADESWLLELASHGEDRQPPPNLLFGAVQFLLLSGASHPLVAFYPSMGGSEPADQAWPAFVDFCDQFRSEIDALVRTRRVQTNEVGRCGVLLPAFALAHDAFGWPLHLVELGPSAGLNLFFDQYRYEYSNIHTLGGASGVVIHTDLRGEHLDALPLPTSLPAVAKRTGVDVRPIDVNDRDAMLWLEALIWPSDASRFERFRAAVANARLNPPDLRQGDGLTMVPALVAGVAAKHLPCVYHSNAIYQMSRQWRTDFAQMLDATGKTRDMAHISLEWLDDETEPQLRLSMWRNGERTDRHLARCHPHGLWIEPLSRPRDNAH